MHVASSTMAGSRPLQEIYDALGIHYAKGGVEVYTAHIEDLHGVEAVSYTHLDVYKRQQVIHRALGLGHQIADEAGKGDQQDHRGQGIAGGHDDILEGSFAEMCIRDRYRTIR